MANICSFVLTAAFHINIPTGQTWKTEYAQAFVVTYGLNNAWEGRWGAGKYIRCD